MPPEDRHGDAAGQPPEHNGERREGEHLGDQPKHDAKGLPGEGIAVLLDPLLGIVGPVLDQLHAVIGPVTEPLAVVDLGEPAAPADLQHLSEPQAIDRNQDEERRDDDEVAQLSPEGIDVLLFQRIEEARVPVIGQLQDPDDDDVEKEHERQQRTRNPALRHTELASSDLDFCRFPVPPIGGGETPKLAKETRRLGESSDQVSIHRLLRLLAATASCD
jgi:hypothetical protein